MTVSSMVNSALHWNLLQLSQLYGDVADRHG